MAEIKCKISWCSLPNGDPASSTPGEIFCETHGELWERSPESDRYLMANCDGEPLAQERAATALMDFVNRIEAERRNTRGT